MAGPDWAFGDGAEPHVPAKAHIVFELELMSVRDWAAGVEVFGADRVDDDDDDVLRRELELAAERRERGDARPHALALTYTNALINAGGAQGCRGVVVRIERLLGVCTREGVRDRPAAADRRCPKVGRHPSEQHGEGQGKQELEEHGDERARATAHGLSALQLEIFAAQHGQLLCERRALADGWSRENIVSGSGIAGHAMLYIERCAGVCLHACRCGKRAL